MFASCQEERFVHCIFQIWDQTWPQSSAGWGRRFVHSVMMAREGHQCPVQGRRKVCTYSSPLALMEVRKQLGWKGGIKILLKSGSAQVLSKWEGMEELPTTVVPENWHLVANKECQQNLATCQHRQRSNKSRLQGTATTCPAATVYKCEVFKMYSTWSLTLVTLPIVNVRSTWLYN